MRVGDLGLLQLQRRRLRRPLLLSPAVCERTSFPSVKAGTGTEVFKLDHSVLIWRVEGSFINFLK